MSGNGMHWPPVMPSWAYRDPALIAEERAVLRLPRETSTAGISIVRRDRHYTQARRLRIQSLMKGINRCS